MVSSPARRVHEERSRRRESPTGEDGGDSGKRAAGPEGRWHCQRKYKSRRRFERAVQCTTTRTVARTMRQASTGGARRGLTVMRRDPRGKDSVYLVSFAIVARLSGKRRFALAVPPDRPEATRLQSMPATTYAGVV